MTKLFLSNRNFRVLTLFSTIGGIGRGIFSIFMMWAIHAMYESTIYTGIAGFMFGAPMVASFIVGPFVDRWNKATVLRVVEFTKFCMVALLLIAHMFFVPVALLIFAAILIFSTASIFGSPAFTAILPRVVDSEDLVKANVLMSMVGIGGGIVLGVVLITISTGELSFTLFYGIVAGLLLVASLLTLFLRYEESATLAACEGADEKTTNLEHDTDEGAANKDKRTPNTPVIKTYLIELNEGFIFVKKGAFALFTIALITVNIFSEIAYVNLPMLVSLRTGEAFSFMLLSFLALAGSFIGSVICRNIEERFKIWQVLAVSLVIAGIARILFVNILADDFARSVIAFLTYIGFTAVVGIYYQVLKQKLPPKNLISRVATTATSLIAVATAIGALVGGFLGTVLYVDTVFFLQGGAYIALGLLLCLSKKLRRLPKISEIGEADTAD